MEERVATEGMADPIRPRPYMGGFGADANT